MSMGISLDEVKKLAELSRIELSPDEMEKMSTEINSILEYVAVIQKVPLPDNVIPSPHLDKENVMRDDGTPHEPGIYTEKLLTQAPKRDGDFLKVKKVLG